MFSFLLFSFPESQDCHEMWSKERKRQARLDAAGKTGNGGIKVPDVSNPPSMVPTTEKGANNIAQLKTTVSNTTNEGQNTVNKPAEKLPPPPPLPALNATSVLGVTNAKNSSGDSGYNDTPPANPSANEIGFIHRGISHPSKLPTNDTSTKDVPTAVSKVPSRNSHNPNQRPPEEQHLNTSNAKKSVSERRSSVNVDIKLNHFISQPLNLRNVSATADNGAAQRSSQWST